MLIGSYLGLLGEKRRTAIPKKFLEYLGKDLILAKWYESCLILINQEFWNSLFGRLTGESKIISIGVRDIERFILGSAFEVEPDKQGRIIIPEILVEYSELNNDLVFLGLGDRVEIWNKQVWDQKVKEISEISKEFIEKLAKKK